MSKKKPPAKKPAPKIIVVLEPPTVSATENRDVCRVNFYRENESHCIASVGVILRMVRDPDLPKDELARIWAVLDVIGADVRAKFRSDK